MIMARMEVSLRRSLWSPSAETEFQTVKEDARLLVSLVGSWRVPPGLFKAALALAANQDHRGQNDHVRPYEGITVEDVEELIEVRGAAMVLPVVIIEEDWDGVVGVEQAAAAAEL